MKEETNKKNKKIILGIVLLTLIVCFLGLTFAYFTAEVIGNENASTVKANTGKLVIDFETSEYINNLNGELIKDSERETKADTSKFVVQHTVDSKGIAEYNLTLSEINISDNLKNADFKWELLKNNVVLNSGNFSDINNKTELIITPTLQKLEQHQTDNYIFRIWLSETEVDQSNLYNGTFSAKIALSAKSA